MTLLLVLGTLFLLLSIGVPVGFAMASSGSLGLWMLGGMPMLLGVLKTSPLSASST
jgi:hypothetical protein